MLAMDDREALECGGFDAALQRLPPISMFKLNTIAFMNPGARSQETPMRRANAECPHSPVASVWSAA
jgi:hypothetical protein